MSDKSSESRSADCITIKNINSQDVDEIVKKLTGDAQSTVLSYQILPYSAEKLGYSASHLQLNVTFQKSKVNKPETVNLFIKAVPYDNKAQVEMLNDAGIFTKEALIFNTVIPRLIENYKADKWAPVCYLAKQDVLVLEDLRSQNYKLVPKFFDEYEILKAGLTALARFHGCSIVAETKLNENSKTPKTLLNHFPEACKEIIFQRTEKICQFVDMGAKLAMVLASNLGYDPDKIKLAFELMYDIVKPSKKHRNVLCHGDLWPNNMMFDVTGPLPKCILIDFQICRYAAFAVDILQFVHLNTTFTYRRKCEKDLLKAYHAALLETVRSNDLTKKAKAPTLEEVLAAVDDLRLFGVGITSLYFPLALMEPKHLTKLTENPDDFIFADRTKVTLDYMKKDKAYKAKVEEAIVELAKISERL